MQVQQSRTAKSYMDNGEKDHKHFKSWSNTLDLVVIFNFHRCIFALKGKFEHMDIFEMPPPISDRKCHSLQQTAGSSCWDHLKDISELE